MRIFLVVDSSGFGGIESHLLQLILLFQKKNISFTLLFLKGYPNHPLIQFCYQQKIQCDCLSGTFLSFVRYFQCQSFPYIVHAHGYKASIWIRLLMTWKGLRCITTFHAGEVGDGRVWWYEMINRRSAFLSYNFAVSKELQSSVKNRAMLLPNFIQMPLAYFQKKNRHSRLQVGFVGRLNIVKGIDRYLWFSEHYHDVDWHVFGSGSFDLTGANVIDRGVVPSMDQYWKDLDLLVLPSRFEGLPMVVLEAMSFGVPVLTTDVGDCATVVPGHSIVSDSQWKNLLEKIIFLDQADDDLWLERSRESIAIIKAGFTDDLRWEILRNVYFSE